MRLLHVVPTYLPATRYGGPIWSVHGLCRALAARGHEVHVATTSVDGPGDSDVPLGVPVVRDGVKVWYFPSNKLRRFYYSPDMVRMLEKSLSGFELIHSHAIFNWPVVSAAREALRQNVPYLYAPRGMLMKDAILIRSRWIKMAWIRLFEKYNIENAARIHVTSQLEADELELFGYKLPVTANIPNGMDIPVESIDDKQIDAKLLELSSQPFLLFLSRVSRKKGLDRLVKALTSVPGIRLLICGPDEYGHTSEIRQLSEDEGIAERVLFLGEVHGKEKAFLFRKAAAMVLPSYSENFGNVVPEAMAYGCPVVVTPEVGAAEIVRASGAGVVVDGAPDVLASALKDMLENDQERREMSCKGPAWIKDNLTWDSVAKRMEAVYLDVLAESRK